MKAPTLGEIKHAYFNLMADALSPRKPVREQTMAVLLGVVPGVRTWSNFALRETLVQTRYSDTIDVTQIILHLNSPVWAMHWAGRYDPEAIPLVRESVYNACREMEFYGGRGRPSVRQGNLSYSNRIDRDLMNDFCGEEYVMEGERVRGSVRYCGWALLGEKS